MDWSWYFSQTFFQLTAVIPWLLGGLVGLGIFSFSPLGRELLHRLRAKRHEALIGEATLQELAEVRSLLVEVTERLDVTERRLAQLADRPGTSLPPTQQPQTVSKPVITPHSRRLRFPT